MRNSASFLKLLAARIVFALVLLAFLVPVQGPTPDDEIRAAYAAQGLMCDPDTPSHTHVDSHCVLCLLPASGDAPEAVACDVPGHASRIAFAAMPRQPVIVVAQTERHARAPPSSIV